MPTQQELADTVKHIRYEWAMLRRTAAMLANFDPTTLDDMVAKGAYSAMIESFATHVRTLIEFLYKPSEDRGPNERIRPARAQDFFASGGWRSVWASPKDWPPQAKEPYFQACDQISHLTYHRANITTPADSEWDVVGVCQWLEAQLEGYRTKVRAVGFVTEDPAPDLPPPFPTAATPAFTIPTTAATTGATIVRQSSTAFSQMQGLRAKTSIDEASEPKKII